MGRDLCRTDAAACRSSAGILLVLTQEGPAVLEFQERARSRREADWITASAPRDRVDLVGLGIATKARRKAAER